MADKEIKEPPPGKTTMDLSNAMKLDERLASTPSPEIDVVARRLRKEDPNFTAETLVRRRERDPQAAVTLNMTPKAQASLLDQVDKQNPQTLAEQWCASPPLIRGLVYVMASIIVVCAAIFVWCNKIQPYLANH